MSSFKIKFLWLALSTLLPVFSSVGAFARRPQMSMEVSAMTPQSLTGGITPVMLRQILLAALAEWPVAYPVLYQDLRNGYYSGKTTIVEDPNMYHGPNQMAFAVGFDGILLCVVIDI